MRLLESAGAPRLTLAAVGDVGVNGRVRAFARAHGYDAVFAAVAPALRAADLGFANLEFPVADPDEVRPGRSREFWQEPEVVPALGRAGVRVLSLATNHMMDAGPRGLERTLAACASAGVAAAGAGADLDAARRPAWLEVAGRRVALLAYGATEEGAAGVATPGVAPLDPDLVREDLARLGGGADARVVSVHWGSMYVDYPPPRVLALARVLQDGGVDVVLGHHPHVLQGVRREGRTVVLFSLGDVAFDSRAGDYEAKVAAHVRHLTGVFTVEVADAHGVAVAPLALDEHGVPRAADAAQAAAVEERLVRLSAGLGDAAARFASESAPTLLRYELQSLGTYLRQGRIDQVLRLIGSVRPRHLPVLWQALKRLGKTA